MTPRPAEAAGIPAARLLSAMAFLAILLPSCAPTVTIPVSEQVSFRSDREWFGDWFAKNTSYYGHESSNGLRLNPDGTGYAVTSAIFDPRHNPSFWVARHDFRWTRVSPTTLRIDVTGRNTLAGGGSYGIWAKTRSADLIATRSGLRMAGLGREGAIFLKHPKPLTRPMDQAIVQETRDRALAMGGNENPHTGPTLADIAASALAGYQQGLALRQAIDGNATYATMASYKQGGNPALAANNVGGNVTLDAAIMSQYTDGKAYDILVVLPDGKTAGELCYQYGLSRDNARSLLANSYAATGTRSAYGPGNPQSLISWRSYPVRQGQTIKMAIEWKRGQAYAAPFQNRYATSKP